MSLNSVNIMGNLTRDPEMRFTSSGRPVCNLSIANNRVFSKDGQKTQEVSYFDIEVWGVIAENCAKYLAKGSGIIVEGRLKQDRWDKDGKTQSKVRIVANNVHFMPKRQGDGGGGYDGGGYQSEPAPSRASAGSPAESSAWEE
ncbi:MAG: single-stranded DNA-binding protein [Candidatus Omnitrophica bacterium]|nr:single-stranded DNA-binding protein [Candidatus Omnitrophota bacterium]MCB9721625.1 single-stranded DNA-binding protein [Candidatus Omnitrophota bacterium]